MTNREKYEDLYAKIVQLGIDNSILPNGNVLDILTLVSHRAYRGWYAIDHHTEDEAIGDVMMNLIILNELIGCRMLHLSLRRDCTGFNSWKYLCYGVGNARDQILYNGGIIERPSLANHLVHMSDIIQAISLENDHDFIECLESAYRRKRCEV